MIVTNKFYENNVLKNLFVKSKVSNGESVVNCLFCCFVHAAGSTTFEGQKKVHHNG